MFHLSRSARNDLLVGASFISGMIFTALASSFGYLQLSSTQKANGLAADSLHIRFPINEFHVSTNEDSVWFAFELVNPTAETARIVGFETSCSCTEIKQQLPFDIPSLESRFIIGEIDTSDLSQPITIKSRIFSNLGLTENTTFSVSLIPSVHDD